MILFDAIAIPIAATIRNNSAVIIIDNKEFAVIGKDNRESILVIGAAQQGQFQLRYFQ
ncbi:hypothetical protein [Wolbachia endosymbiont of Wuchereria bancrofti]|uniref:hypothetical protein n=1 Tax=Wolbachia endosymbiont of Wuchereria bancrofti TaxID=96496 RepID=UPI0015D0C977|nr:hypothetical protein [Wolbachia endosymbiont of Wuchereria bancrofti]